MSLRKLAIAGTALTAMMASTAYASVIDRPFFQVLGVVVVWGADGFDDASGTQAPIVSDFVVGLGTGGTDLIAGDVTTVLTGSLTPISATGGDIDAATFDPITGQVDVGAAVGGGVFNDANGDGLLDVGDSLTAFGIDANTDVDAVGNASHRSSFFVASNTPFEIRASRTQTATTGNLRGIDATGNPVDLNASNISWDMDIQVEASAADNGGLAFGSEAQTPEAGAAGITQAVTSLQGISTNNAAPTSVFIGGQRTAQNPGSLTEQSVRFDLSYDLDTNLQENGIQGFDLSAGVGTITTDVTYTVFVP